MNPSIAHSAPRNALDNVPTFAILLCGMVIMTACALAPIPVLRALVVLPLAMLLPGVALLSCLDRNAVRQDPIPSLGLSALTSIGFYPLMALALYGLSVRLSTVSVLIATDLFVITLIAILVQQEQLSSHAVASGPSMIEGESRTVGKSFSVNGALLLVAAAVALAVLGGAVRALPAARADTYTEFYLAGSSAHMHSTLSVEPGQVVSVNVAVVNHEGGSRTYHIRPALQGGTTWDSTTAAVAPAHGWKGQVEGVAPTRPGTYRLALGLSNGSKLAATLTLWLSVK